MEAKADESELAWSPPPHRDNSTTHATKLARRIKRKTDCIGGLHLAS